MADGGGRRLWAQATHGGPSVAACMVSRSQKSGSRHDLHDRDAVQDLIKTPVRTLVNICDGCYNRREMLEFRLLGPLEVVSEDGVLQLGGQRQRAVLAVLLLRAGEVVPTERLVDLLWGEHRRRRRRRRCRTRSRSSASCSGRTCS